MFINQENVQCMSPKCVPRRCFSFLCISPAGVCVSYVGRSCQEGFWRQADRGSSPWAGIPVDNWQVSTTVESPPIKQGIEISMIVNEFTGGSTVGSTQGAPHGARARGACCYSYRLRNQDTWFLSAWSAPVLHARCASS